MLVQHKKFKGYYIFYSLNTTTLLLLLQLLEELSTISVQFLLRQQMTTIIVT